SFGWASVTGAAFGFSLASAALFLLREPPIARQYLNSPLHASSDVPAYGIQANIWSILWSQLKKLFTSRSLWIAGGMFLLVLIAPGFNGQPLLFYQTNDLKL